MKKLSQNKKIGISVAVIFTISFIAMILFLQVKTGEYAPKSKVDVIGSEQDIHTKSEGDSSFLEDMKMKYLENSTLPHLIIDSDGQVDHASQSFSDLLKQDLEKIKEVSFYDIVNSKDLPEMVATVTKLFRDGVEMNGTGPYRLNMGENEVLVILDFKPVSEEEGKVLFLFIEVKDITKQVNEMQDDGSEAEAMIKIEEDLQRFPQIKAIPNEELQKIIVDRISFMKKQF